MGKYVYEFGGGFKDEGPASTLTLFAGYTNIDVSNSKDAVSFAAGGYAIGNGLGTAGPDNNYFTTTKNSAIRMGGSEIRVGLGLELYGSLLSRRPGRFYFG